MTPGARGSDPLNLPAIEARLNAATPGPWRAMNDGNCRLADGTGVGQSRVDGLPRPYDPRWIGYKRKKSRLERHHTTMLRDEDATFVAHSPDDVRALLAALRDARAALRDIAEGEECDAMRKARVALEGVSDE